jgi:hypothetical protein
LSPGGSTPPERDLTAWMISFFTIGSPGVSLA